jgi:hypothetical protein
MVMTPSKLASTSCFAESSRCARCWSCVLSARKSDDDMPRTCTTNHKGYYHIFYHLRGASDWSRLR